jgi:poly-gamma-glutamate capsule biosynthesis protein CapA/YwtB (metallophosphatase superfamily)
MAAFPVGGYNVPQRWLDVAGRCSGEVTPVRNALKALGAALAVIAMCTPLIFWPVDEAQPTSGDLSAVTVTVSPRVVVTATTLPPETTTTTEAPVQPSQPEPTSSTTTTSTTTTTLPIRITVAAVGDVLPHTPILDAALDPETGSYDFGSMFAPVAPYLAGADYTVANLETRLAGPQAGYSGYPLLNSPTELAGALKFAGVDLVATANNHSLDMGWDGIVGTLDRLDTVGLAHVGTYRSSKERRTPFIANIRGIKVAFLNYTASLNGLTPPKEQAAYAVNTLDPDVVAEDAMTARTWGADVVIALLHYGDEYEREPSEQQEEISREILSRGVDVIIGTHPHVVQPIAHVVEYASWKAIGKYVVYSVGNFISAQRWRYSDSGLVAYVHLEKRGLRTVVTGVSYLPVYVQLSNTESPARYRVLPVLPGVEPQTDIPPTAEERERMAGVWEELRDILYRPDENIAPIDPADLGL